VPEPELRQGTVKIAVDWCGICGTDLHEYLEGPIFVPTPEQPHPITGASMPVQLGHEFALGPPG
jgi:(R,R)-butanediol dehydrogenase / meso-butanediol dehydrogenase / diacetyl reductase